MNLINSNVAKSIVNVLTLVVSLGSFALAPSGALGLSQNALYIIGLVVAVAGAVLHYLQPNANQPTLLPGQVVVNQAQMVPGTVPAAVHKP